MSVWGDESETLLPQTPIKLYSSTISIHRTIVKHERSKIDKSCQSQSKKQKQVSNC